MRDYIKEKVTELDQSTFDRTFKNAINYTIKPFQVKCNLIINIREMSPISKEAYSILIEAFDKIGGVQLQYFHCAGLPAMGGYDARSH